VAVVEPHTERSRRLTRGVDSCLLRPFIALLFFCARSFGAAPITAKNFALAAAYSRSHGGLGVRVQQGGQVVFENYISGFSANTPHRIYSGTKNFVALAALIAEQQGLLTMEEPASQTLTEWQHDRRRAITIHQLLTQTSGLEPGTDIIDDARDQMAAALRVPLIDPPGTRFHYGPVGYQAFGEILKRKLRPRGESVEGYIKGAVFGPLQIHIASWKEDDAGNPLMHAGLWLTAEEWAKFGEFIKTLGYKHQKQLIKPELIPTLFTPLYPNPAYGLSWWLNRAESAHRVQKLVDLLPAIDGDMLYPGGPKDIYAAEGTSHQRLYVIPSLDLVVVRFGYGGSFSDGDFLSRLITGQPHPDAHTH
jgi:CubicO group peptidase (beta-lactamase class C family)